MYLSNERRNPCSPPIRSADILLFAAFALCLAVLAAVGWSRPAYNTDSWAYYELSNSLWSGGYNLKHLRNFTDSSAGPTTSLPPLWPLALLIFAKLGNLGARSGYVLALGLTFAFGVLSELIGRRLFNLRHIGLFAAAFVSFTPGYLIEMTGACSIPLQLALSAIILLFLLNRPSPSSRDAAVLGFLSGALVLCRFDMLPFALIFGAGLVVLTRSPIVAAAFAAAVLLTLSPWIAASIIWHGKLFATDNAGVALSTDLKAHVTDWYPVETQRANLFSSPFEWLLKIAINIARFVKSFSWYSTDDFGKILLGAIAALAIINHRLFRNTLSSLKYSIKFEQKFTALACFFIAIAFALSSYIVVGYFHGRYYSLFIWVSILILVGITAKAWGLCIRLAVVDQVTFAFSGVSLLIFLVQGINYIGSRQYRQEIFPQVAEYGEIKSCLAHPSGANAQRLLLTDGELAAHLSAVYGLETAFLPANFERTAPTEAEFKQFLRTQRIAYLGGDRELIERIFPSNLLEEDKRNCGIPLYKVSLPPS